MKRTLLIGCALGGVILAMEYRPDKATAAVLTEPSDCVMCHEDCPEGQHVAANDGFTLPKKWHRSGGAHNNNLCIEGSCFTKHGPDNCSGEEDPPNLAVADYNVLRRAIVRGDHRTIRRLLHENPARVVVNVARSAVQVSDCRGAYVAHFPIDPELTAMLLD